MKRIEDHKGSGNRQPGGRWSTWSAGLALAALGALLVSFAARADENGPGAGSGMAGAARLSSVEGQVRLLQGGQVIADPALVNAPLFAGVQIQTSDDGKAEIQFDDGSIARVTPDSGMTVKSIAGGGGPGTTIVLDGGMGYFELQGGQTQVIFGDTVVTANGFTVIRVKMDTPPGELAVFSGNARLQRGNAMTVEVRGGENVTLDGSDASRYNLSESIEPDSWDTWNQDRDQALNAAAANQTGATSNYVNNDNPNPAWNDLDANGSWYNVPGQGYVWSPYAASTVGWDPYGCGNWMWTPRYGYVWVSCESWGFLPYSCGAWNFYDGFGWGWAPGMGGCMPWWRGGTYVGWNIGRAPLGYRPMPRPIAHGPIGRIPPRTIPVRGRTFVTGAMLPARNRDAVVQIGGHMVQPLRPTPGVHSFVRPAVGYSYRPGSLNGAQGGSHFNTGGSANGPSASPRGGELNNMRQAPGNRPGYTSPGVRQDRGQPSPVFITPNQNNGQQNRNFTSQPRNNPSQQQQQHQPQQQPRNNYTSQPGRTYTPPSSPSPTHNVPSGGGRPSGGGGFSGGGAPHPSGGGQPSSGGHK